MAISMASLRRGGEVKAPRGLIYGTHGIGKTSLAAAAPDPVFIQTEDGLMADVPTFGLLRTFSEVMEAGASLYNEEHRFRTVVIDTIDWLEPIVWAETCRRNSWKGIDDGSKETGYGKGFLAAQGVWRELLELTNALRDDKGMAVLFLAHAEVKSFNSPEVDPFDRYQPKLQKNGSALIQEHVDMVLFNGHMISTVKSDPKDPKSHVRGVGGGNRVIYAEERPAYLAKNRYDMPAQIMLPDNAAAAWATVAQHIPFFNQSTMKEAA